MGKTFIRRVFGLLFMLFLCGSMAVSCYDDSELRNSINDLKNQLAQLQTLVNSLQNDDAVLGVTKNADGSYTIKFKKSGDVTISNGKDGAAGKDGTIVNVVKGIDTFTFVFADGSTFILPRYSETRVLTFEDVDYKGPEEIANYWSSKIDDPQFGGELLYDKGCTWKDEQNTFVSGSVLPYDPVNWIGGMSGGGIAISNYGCYSMEDINSGYLRQLEVMYNATDVVRKGAGADGSDNFAVIYDGGAWGSNPAALTMSDKQPRLVESAMVNNTNYTWHTLIYGNSGCAPLAPGTGFFKVTATGYLAGAVTGTSEYYLAKNGIVYSDWRKWDLSELGYVDQIVFSLSGSDELYGDWGLNAPAYFAIDDVTVRVYPD